MAEKGGEMAKLKLRLEESEKNTILAATYGKQLLDENHEMHAKLEETVKGYSVKLEALKQEKHAITLKLDNKLQNEQSLIHELEQLREQQTKHIESKVALATHPLEKEIQKLHRTITAVEADLEREQTENQQHVERTSLIEAQLHEAQERIDMYNTSIHDVSTDETTATMQSQIMTLTCEKQELEMKVSSLSARLKTTKLKLSQAEKNAESLQKEVENLECQSTSYFNVIEHMKEDVLECKMEIEALKLGQTDPGKKGNSLFAEVEDQRQVIDKQLQEYKSNYNVMKSQFEIKTQLISKMKLQLANLLSLSNKKADAEYLIHLEESLACARSQLEALTKKCPNDVAKQTDATAMMPNQHGSEAEGTDEQNMTSFFKNLYIDSQKKGEEVDQDLKTAQFEKVVLSDRILQLQRKLRQVESAKDTTNSKLITLQVKYEELASKKGETLGACSKNVKQITEKIPGFDSASSVKKEEEAVQNESRLPLQEKPVNVNATSGTITHPNDDQCPIEDSGNTNMDVQDPKLSSEEKVQENRLAAASVEPKKKTKKSVRMIEKVAVQEIDGEVMWTFKVKDNRPSVPLRRKSVIDAIAESSLHFSSIETTRQAFNIVCEQGIVEDYFKPETISTFDSHGFTLICPPELKALKTVFVRGIGDQFLMYTREQLSLLIVASNDVLVEEVMKIANSPKTLKIRFTTIETAKKVAKEGFTIMTQVFQPPKIQRETFVRIDPCRVCYKYSHSAKDCPTPDLKICSECASEGHIYRECTSTTKKCVNCQGDHRTLSAKCGIRKQLAREKAIEIREQHKEKEKQLAAMADYFQLPPEVIANTKDEVIASYHRFCEQEKAKKSSDQAQIDDRKPKCKLTTPNQSTSNKQKGTQAKAVTQEVQRDASKGAISKTNGNSKKENPSAVAVATEKASTKNVVPEEPEDDRTPAAMLGIRVFCSVNLKMQSNPKDEDILLASVAGILKIVFGKRKFSRSNLIQRIKSDVVTFRGSEIEYCDPEMFNRLANEDYIPKGLFK